ncbi:hypothetical protein N7468_000847 [Penicillium chermesinum]|uniref:Ankyrin repeat protein n=1 Tax=Penicillium chermesinum TaxID=63820 RepID=A0A9W9PFQ9_9EURO|nr:uncharacterized protein N7468_000847 [Penicillium chermesinum]KAJ5245864.1 hypothetical protein N7468_000847 [Penicillium chermesinum]KAJ6144161.1 hypothetical protein N7470_008056 [Penicillium chermesinum]
MSIPLSQTNFDRSLRSFINDIRAERLDALTIHTVQNVLSKSVAETTKEEAWAEIQAKLEELGIPIDQSTRDRNYVVSALRKAVEDENLLRNIQFPTSKPGAPIVLESPARRVPSHDALQTAQGQSPSETQGPAASTPDYYREDFGLSDKITIPQKNSRANFRLKLSASAVPTLDAENLPIPVDFDSRGTGDSEKQVVTTSRTHEDFPIPVSATFSPVDDADKEVLPYESFAILSGVETTGDHSNGTRSASQSEGSRPSLPSPALTSTISHRPSSRSAKSSKRPSIMSRMKFKLSTSKDEFISVIQAGNFVPVQVALDKGADPDTMNLQGQTALMVACSFGHESIVHLLLEYGAHPNKMSNKGDTALTVAASRGYEGIVRLLLGRGAQIDGSKNIGKTALSSAAENGHENMVRILFNSGADINALCHTGDTALAQAASNGHHDIARFLLDNGAYVDLTAYPRQTPLYKAVYNGHTAMVQLLLERGADPNCADSVRGQTPLRIAALYRRTEIIYLLQQLGYQVPMYDFQPLSHSFDDVIF